MEDKAKDEAIRRRVIMLCAVMFAIGAVALAAKHKPMHAVVFLGFALLNAAALYFRLKAKRL